MYCESPCCEEESAFCSHISEQIDAEIHFLKANITDLQSQITDLYGIIAELSEKKGLLNTRP